MPSFEQRVQLVEHETATGHTHSIVDKLWDWLAVQEDPLRVRRHLARGVAVSGTEGEVGGWARPAAAPAAHLAHPALTSVPAGATGTG